ncbi:MAG: DUF5655 domain-containing protein, partial [Nitrospinota bacterium]|nr:DUF5655 domain-containing protein [Nitrospinota bacterium]
GKVRKALQCLMTDPPRPFLNLIRTSAGDGNLAPQRIKESLSRIATEPGIGENALSFNGSCATEADTRVPEARSSSAKQVWDTRRAKKGESPYDEAHHLTGKPQEAVSLYRAIDRLCMSYEPSGISRRYLAKTINYEHAKRCFCSVHILQGGLRVWLRLKLGHIQSPPPFARDVANIGHWGNGDLELRIGNRAELDEASPLIRRSFDTIG